MASEREKKIASGANISSAANAPNTTGYASNAGNAGFGNAGEDWDEVRLPEPEKKPKNKKKKKSSIILPSVMVTVAILLGLALLLYPSVSDYVNSLDYKKVIEDYDEQVQTVEEPVRDTVWEAAKEWNARLLARSSAIGALSAQEREEYLAQLSPNRGGMIGYIAIEKIGVALPIYHGVEESVLQSGVGHIEGSSLPVGGIGTHAILSGHTGLPSTKLFSNIDELKPGDTFTLNVLGRVLTYKVTGSDVMLPEEAEKQFIDPAADKVTLMTCTPYGVNTHRLLVYAERVIRPGSSAEEEEEAPPAEIHVPLPLPLRIAVIAVPIILLVIILVVIRKRRKRKKGNPPNKPGAAPPGSPGSPPADSPGSSEPPGGSALLNDSGGPGNPVNPGNS